MSTPAPIPSLKGVKIGKMGGNSPAPTNSPAPKQPQQDQPQQEQDNSSGTPKLPQKTKLYLIIAVVILVLGFVGYKVMQSQKRSKIRNVVAAAGGQALGEQTKTSKCEVTGSLPDRACTPGTTLVSQTETTVCKSGNASANRNVSATAKKSAYLNYGIKDHAAGEYEVDHLVPLSLGGGNTSANIWPEATSPAPGWKEKDLVEVYLYDHVCNGDIDLKTAQQAIATNWLAIYEKIK